MRGKLSSIRREECLPGLIPAHAGKTCNRAAPLQSEWAHPRACGENFSIERDLPWQRGSSPRMRGKLASSTIRVESSRLIPAHAGKTGGSIRLRCMRAAHPRACGENFTLRRQVQTLEGSSPRMRGKPYRENAERSTYGLIPAHAGKTWRLCALSPRAWAHPRACGENAVLSFFIFPFAGSSPRMRGKQQHVIDYHRTLRLIPAHAGKTAFARDS